MRKWLIAAATAAALVLGIAPAAHADQFVQLGNFANDGRLSTGVASKITQPPLTPAVPSSRTIDRFYFVGLYTTNGAFYQAGWRDPGADSECTSLQNFVAHFDPAGNMILYNKGPCGLSGTRTFGLVRLSQSNGNSTWAAEMDGQEMYGNRANIGGATAFYASRGNVVSEISTTTSFGGTNYSLGRVTYDPAVNVRLSSNGSWVNQQSGKMYRANTSNGSYVTPCTYNLTVLGYDAHRVYSGNSGDCLADGASLW